MDGAGVMAALLVTSAKAAPGMTLAEDDGMMGLEWDGVGTGFAGAAGAGAGGEPEPPPTA